MVKSKYSRKEKARGPPKRRKLRIMTPSEMTAEADKVEVLTARIKDLESVVSFLNSESRRLSESGGTLESRISDLKDYFGNRIRSMEEDVDELDSRIEETRVSVERLSRDFDRFLESELPVRRIKMPPPITPQLTIYKGMESLSFQIGVTPGTIEDVMDRAKAQVDRQGKPDEEIVGILTGRVVGKTVVVEEAISGRPSYSGLTEVALDPKNLAEIVDSMMKEGKNRSIVGWYHSHLGLGVFLSDVDVKTQLTLQQFTYVIALVVDPIKNEHAFFYVDRDVKMPDGRLKVIKFEKAE